MDDERGSMAETKVEAGVAGNTEAATSRGTPAQRLWRSGLPLSEFDVAGRYLTGRGLDLFRPLPSLRFSPSAQYKHRNGAVTYHPALIAQFADADRGGYTVHLTFLQEGHNNIVLPITNGMMLQDKTPFGGAIRLANAADTLGIAPSVESGLAVMALHDDLPVWVAPTHQTFIRWAPPKIARNVIVFGECDEKMEGQVAAYSLGHRLHSLGVNVEVRFPIDSDMTWCDMLSVRYLL